MILSLLKGEITEEEILRYYNANISYYSLPLYIRGFVFQYKNVYNIFINKKLDDEFKRNTILHELAHIELNHLCQSSKDLFAFHIVKYEDEASEYLNRLKQQICFDK